MNKRAFYVLLKEYREGKDKDLGNVILVSFRKLNQKDQLEILLEQNESELNTNDISQKVEKEDIKDVIKEANELELIKMKSFLLKSIILTLIAAVLIFTGLMAWYIHIESDNGFFEYIDQIVKMIKLIVLDN